MSAKAALQEVESVSIAGKTLAIKPISILKLWSIVEDWILSSRLKRIVAVADKLSDRDGYIKEQAATLPDGIALEHEAIKLCGSADMPDEISVRVLMEAFRNAGERLSEDEAAHLFVSGTNDEVQVALRKALNLGESKKNESRQEN